MDSVRYRSIEKTANKYIDMIKVEPNTDKYQKKYKYIKDLYSHSQYTQKNNILSLRFFFFKYFPFKIANFIIVKLLT